MKVVTGIEQLDKKRCRIYIDRQPAFVLYRKELALYGIREDHVLSEENHASIMTVLLPKRAKKRCLYLLQRRPYTEKKLREKLEEGSYPLEVIDQAIAYVKSFHYLDDYDYACQYVFYHMEKEPRRKMEEKLLLRGIDRTIIDKVMEESYEEEGREQELEIYQAQQLLEKRHYDPQRADFQDKRKQYAYLQRKGISPQIIKKVLSVEGWEE